MPPDPSVRIRRALVCLMSRCPPCGHIRKSHLMNGHGAVRILRCQTRCQLRYRLERHDPGATHVDELRHAPRLAPTSTMHLGVGQAYRDRREARPPNQFLVEGQAASSERSVSAGFMCSPRARCQGQEPVCWSHPVIQGQPSVPSPSPSEHHVCPAQHAAPFEMHAAGRIVRRALPEGPRCLSG